MGPDKLALSPACSPHASSLQEVSVQYRRISSFRCPASGCPPLTRPVGICRVALTQNRPTSCSDSYLDGKTHKDPLLMNSKMVPLRVSMGADVQQAWVLNFLRSILTRLEFYKLVASGG
jgi:hypothetical protein